MKNIFEKMIDMYDKRVLSHREYVLELEEQKKLVLEKVAKATEKDPQLVQQLMELEKEVFLSAGAIGELEALKELVEQANEQFKGR